MLDDARPGMDPDTRPQDDLFGHVNGRWLAEVEIPADRSSWGPFVQLADVAEEQVRLIIEELAELPAEELSDDARKIGDLYTSFMAVDRINAMGTRPVEPLVAAVAGLRDVRDLAAFLGELERIGGHGLFGSYVNTDAKDSDRYLLHLGQGGLGLPDESYYRDDKFAETREKYVAYLARLLTLGGVEAPAAAAARILEIDTRLAEGHWERSETRDVQKTYNLLTDAALEELCPAFDWHAYLTNLGGTRFAPEEVLREVVVRQPSFFEHLSTVLEEVSIEDWRTWLTSRVLRSAAAYLTDDFVEANFDFYGRTLNGTPELRARWKRGVELRGGGDRRGRRRAVRRATLPAAVEGAHGRAGRQPARRLPGVDRGAGLDERGHQEAGLRQARAPSGPRSATPTSSATTPRCASPPTTCSATWQPRRPSRPTASWARSAPTVDRDEWFMLPQTVNAYYNPGVNEICFPAGILQKPFFSPDAVAAENYGGIGAVIGHEIGHGFDDQGAQYDELGNLVDWWTADDKAAFEEKSPRAGRAVRRASARGRCRTSTSTASSPSARTSATSAASPSATGRSSSPRARPDARRARRTAAPCSPTGPTCGAPSGAPSRSGSTSPSTRTARRSSAPTSCATSTSSTRSSRPPWVTVSGSTRASASGSGDRLGPDAGSDGERPSAPLGSGRAFGDGRTWRVPVLSE